ncbi:MAG: DUF86 domain-containing protein [Pseudomonadota bacterium]
MTSPEKRLQTLLAQLSQTAEQAMTYVEGMSKDNFMADAKTQDAVIMKILVIGELAAKILDQYPDFSDQQTQIPWRAMKGIRNRMAHGYFELNLDTVWETAATEIPQLHSNLQPLLP